MTIKSGFFNSEEIDDGLGNITYSKEYFAADYANYFGLFVTDGIFINPADQLRISVYSGLTIKVSKGWAFIKGYWFHNDSDYYLTISANMGSVVRKDSIVIKLDTGTEEFTLEVKEDNISYDRVSPIYELQLGIINVGVAAPEILGSMIIDNRGLAAECPFITGLMEVADIDNIWTQYQASLDEFLALVATAVDETLAGNLQTQIDNLLNGTVLAGDSSRLGGVLPSGYATAAQGTKADAALPSGSNAVSATKLATARTISLSGDADGSVSFDGTADAAINITVANDSHTHDTRYYTETESNAKYATAAQGTKADGALPSGSNAVSATKLATARTIDITGDITAAAVSFNGTANVSISATVNNDSHTHDTQYSKLSHSYNLTLSSGSWSSGVYSLAVTGVTTTSNQEVILRTTVTDAERIAFKNAGIVGTGQSAGHITLKAFEDVPTISIPITVIVRGDA
ncbi:hypothetical protein [Clostridium sp.]|uniref:hypothetical protein n=1 Tax=Clostridium sp. TaxID=1506 RepID=UPI001A4C951E|nr:hypothetical protein [Clostridium sp.]MBK5234053.1 hypothetical protein [Clostridium sp.]